MLAPPTGLLLTGISATEIDIQFTGVALADHYDVYRSSSVQDVGSKINNSPIAQTADPFTTTYADNAANSVIPPVQGNIYFYRAVAADSLGNISIPSISLEVLDTYPPLLTPEAPVLISVQERGS
jgi:hypothetical protein